ncbi:hypothetical protein [Glutamicibacter sp. FBE19]|nr:hypothetical protein [Glutamicibacter sp. FBE19]MBF6671670.1 hypothetical protein [Glutamicibacter sp. FBE19]
MEDSAHNVAQKHANYTPALVITWTIVSVPLIYGLFNAAKAELQLFTG